MKTILIPVFHGHIARNILRTDVLPELLKGSKVVLVVPVFKKDLYENEFSSERLVVVASPQITHSYLDRFFRSFYYYFVNTNTVRIIQGEQFRITKRYVKWIFVRVMTKIIGNSRILRNFIRKLDGYFVRDTFFSSLFDVYRPDLVFIPSITSDDEGLVLRQARQRRIKVVGMVRSWDNITVNKGNIRVFPDKLLVHNTHLRDDVIRYADMSPSKIEVVGMPHFDYYKNSSRIPREEFFKLVGGDPNKKTIYFMPVGLSDKSEDVFMLGLLEKWIEEGSEFKGVQLIISSHPNTTKQIDYAGPGTLVVNFSKMADLQNGKITDREILKEDMELMSSAIFHSDVIVNYQGTTTIDAVAFNKPVINIAFDSVKNKPYLSSIRRFYDFNHYQSIVASGGVKVVKNAQDLRQEIIVYLYNPSKDSDGRKKIVSEQVFKHDGRASRRIAISIISML